MSIKQFPGGIITQNPTAPTTAAAKGIWTLAQASDFVKQGIWPRSPGAPTIGTATTSTPTTASVPFTAPSDLGTGSVTFTATSSPSGITGTGASPITVSGLTTGTAYTFTVTASTPGGSGPASAASNSVTPALPAIGSVLEGGYFAGQISTAGNGIADYNLVVGPISTAQNANKQFKTSNTGGDPTSVIAGPANSATMNSATYPAAQFCENLTVGGYTDWYLPAKNELEVCYYNLKPTTGSNNTVSGINANAVPARASNYTNSPAVPSQTSATDFRNTGGENFSNVGYWSSSQRTSLVDQGYGQYFTNGNQGYYLYKTSNRSVRAIRRVAV